MLNKILQNKANIFISLLLVCLLAAVRGFEDDLFYDPLLVYFEGDYMAMPLPEFNPLLLFLGLLFRYVLNTILSLGIIYFLFKDKEMVKFASILYLIFFLILMGAFFFILYFYGNQNNFLLFYVRRFLIQPLFLILFTPAFYFQKLGSVKK
ncbi:exosortase F system-associated protein [Flavobacterium sp. ZT3R18]|uniref:exosortase F system-associated membrane protein n=1 Tax=Flavobacterium sp. ZT3R18 TaxID=2594429 RepID=UPI00117A1DCE|nr:exosortase F system-associated protein [Flavobacterium sp. ZT3R18]TRX38799.1 exosortase F system-associated protein [Flavobacterium sp. ZT3R18]